MKPSKRMLTVGLAVTTLLTNSLPSHAQVVTPDEAKTIAEEAYVYGYSLVTMELTRRVMTNVREPVGTRAPIGHWIRMRDYPTAAFRDDTAPNEDVRSSVRFGRGLNPLVGLELSTLQPPQGEPHEEEYAIEEASPAPLPPFVEAWAASRYPASV